MTPRTPPRFPNDSPLTPSVVAFADALARAVAQSVIREMRAGGVLPAPIVPGEIITLDGPPGDNVPAATTRAPKKRDARPRAGSARALAESQDGEEIHHPSESV